MDVQGVGSKSIRSDGKIQQRPLARIYALSDAPYVVAREMKNGAAAWTMLHILFGPTLRPWLT